MRSKNIFMPWLFLYSVSACVWLSACSGNESIAPVVIPPGEDIGTSSSSEAKAELISTLTDARDGQTYRTVVIGSQTWMAENLNRGENSKKYGGFYTWARAMEVCPEGWHLPDTTEWSILIKTVGGEAVAGTMLKSTEGWYNKADGTSGNGSDDFGFSALPAGYGYKSTYGTGSSHQGDYALFWTSTESDGNYAYYVNLIYSYDYGEMESGYKDQAFSVRCIKD